ncbi:Cytochrome P450 9e2 [Eumeta japonica]|uniref:unspecific monooxygenase n=1 Tax=Eumeta variegata TaxID=151549 RepID=A0A4C1UJ35_EUMVA|nr:Cytochrome P450 9e2 [Eumeta japonica]
MLWLYLRKTYSYFKNHEINYLPPLPVVGNMGSVLFRSEHSVYHISKLYTAFPADRFVGLYEFTNKNVFLRDPELIKLIGVKDFDYFTHRRGLGNGENNVLGKSLFGLKGQKWRDMRSTLSPAFTGSKLRGMVPLMQNCSKNLVRFLDTEIETTKTGYLDLDTRDMFSRYTNDVIATCAFGLQVDSVAEKENEFYKMGEKLTTLRIIQFLQIIFNVLFPFFNKIATFEVFSKEAIGYLRSLVFSAIKNRDDNKAFRPDLIQILLEAKKGTLKHENLKDEKDAGFATVEESTIGKNAIKRTWDDEDLFAQAILFFFAGFETVSTAIVFLLYELALNPDIQTKLREEIDSSYNKYSDKIDYDKINQMKYLDMVVSEGLRKWPPVPVLDRLEKDSVIGIAVWPIHHDPQYYPEPEMFDPERFSDENKHSIKPFTYLPFGIGPRNCIGSRFALIELKIMIFDLLRHFELSPAPNTKIPPELDPMNGLMRMRGGHWLRITSRKHKLP